MLLTCSRIPSLLGDPNLITTFTISSNWPLPQAALTFFPRTPITYASVTEYVTEYFNCFLQVQKKAEEYIQTCKIATTRTLPV